MSLQTVSGTGAVHLGAIFLAHFYPQNPKQLYFSSPTWANHNQIFSNVGLPIKTYPYFSPQTKGLDFDGMRSTIEQAPEGSIILLHACAHNPTGVDPTRDQWKEIAKVIRAKKHFPFFDCAYQGFASGDLENDVISSPKDLSSVLLSPLPRTLVSTANGLVLSTLSQAPVQMPRVQSPA